MQDLYYRYDIVAYTLIADIACNALKMRCTAFLCVGSIVCLFGVYTRCGACKRAILTCWRLSSKSGLLASDICYDLLYRGSPGAVADIRLICAF